jgi:hypothetical protein
MNDGLERKVHEAMTALAHNLMKDYSVQIDRVQFNWMYTGSSAAQTIDRSLESIELSLRVLPLKV